MTRETALLVKDLRAIAVSVAAAGLLAACSGTAERQLVSAPPSAIVAPMPAPIAVPPAPHRAAPAAPIARPMPSGYHAVGVASWYGKPYHGRKTANGEIYDMQALTAAHPNLPFGTRLEVTNLANNRSLVVTVNDRGPFVGGRIIDVSRRAAADLGFLRAGLAQVRIQEIGSALTDRQTTQVAPGPGPAQQTARIVDASAPLQCVAYARDASGIAIRGDAETWWQSAEQRYRRGFEPALGAVLVLAKTSRLSRGHVAVVRQFVNEREIIVDHANWLNQGQVHLSTPVRDISPDNDWSVVRVWYTPGNSYGTRNYLVQGFIYPDPEVAGRAE